MENKYFYFIIGIITIISSNITIIVYSYVIKNNFKIKKIQGNSENYKFLDALCKHFSHIEGFLLIGIYLSITWYFNFLPLSYYNFEEGIDLNLVFVYLLFQDFLQYLCHRFEHLLSKINPYLYKISHKHHHKYTNPSFFDSYSGSAFDTIVMIIIPLYITSLTIPLKGWEYILSGNIYSCWLTLIHSEFSHPWDNIFQFIGFGTPEDHHVHHKGYKYNYGHLFMYWDILFKTYKNPKTFF